MKKIYLSRLLSVIAIVFFSTMAGFADDVQTITYNHDKDGMYLVHESKGNVAINFSISTLQLQSFSYNDETMQELGVNGVTIPNDKGMPNVPVFSRFIAIPQGAQAVVHVKNIEKEVISGVNVAPSLGCQNEALEPDMNYVKNEKVYSEDALYPAEIVNTSDVLSLRGVNAVALSISPIQFNPVKQEIVVYHSIELEVEFVGGNGHFGEDRLRSPYWDPILQNNLINYNSLPKIDYEARMQKWLRDGDEGYEYLIIIPNNDEWEEQAEILKEYRIRQGILTEVLRLDEMGVTSTNEIKAWFHNAYNTWDIPPVAVCLLADHNTNLSLGIPGETISHPYNGSCITDNQYADPTGDHLPDMTFSRLIAGSAEEVPVFVSKQIEYEYTNPNMDEYSYQNPITALGWQTERWFQLCSEIVGGYLRSQGKTPVRINAIYSGTPGNTWSSNQNTSYIVNYFGPDGLGYIPATPSELGGWSGGTASQIVQAVNNGAFLLQHRDHGFEQGWGEPDFDNSNVSQLTNVGKMSFVMSINCLTGKFNYSQECLAEAFMRYTYNDQNAGAVAMLCPTETSYSFVNDTYVWGVLDHFQPDFMPDYGPLAPNEGNWMPSFANVAGKYFLAQSSWPYNPSDKDITYQMFTAHCDAFLRIYTEVPQTMTVSLPEVVMTGQTQIQITAPENTQIALTVTENGQTNIIAVAEGLGTPQTVEIPVLNPSTIIDVVVTGQNYLRHESEIMVIVAEGPYITLNEYSLSDDNAQLDFGEEAGLDIVLKNVGIEQSEEGTATLTTESEYAEIINGSTSVNSMNPDQTINIDNAFSFSVSDEVPNKTNIDFLLTIVSGDDTYESNITLKAYAPELQIGNVSITEINGNGNGRLDPAEEATLTFTILNKGNSNTNAANVNLTMNNPYIEVLSDPVVIESIEADGSSQAQFTVYVSSNAPAGVAAEYTLDCVSGHYTATKDFISKIGLIVEDFELGVLGEGWTNNSQQPWTFCTEDPYEGTYCLQSGRIGDSGSTTVSLNYECADNDTISFYYKVSSESNYDKLTFYIDNQSKGSWSGSTNWTLVSFPVNGGQHTFTWTYSKDNSVSSGEDCAWIDFVILPATRSLSVSAGRDLQACPESDVQLNGFAQYYNTLTWTTNGDGTFDDPSKLDAIYTLGSQDSQSEEIILTLTATDEENNTLSDDVTVTLMGDATVTTEESATICFNETYISDATATDYNTITWTTDGDGTFDNVNNLNAAYTPGENDINNGTVNLTLTVEGCSTVSSTIALSILGETAVSTSESMIVCQGESATIVADAVNYNTLTWRTEGDGTFNDNSVAEVTYTPGTQDIANGEVVLSVTAEGCSTAEASITLMINALPTLSLATTEYEACSNIPVEMNLTVTGVAPYTVTINEETFDVDETGLLLFTVNPEITDYTITSISDANGCSSECSVSFTVTSTNMSAPARPVGDEIIAKDETATTTYTTELIEGMASYEWNISPAEAGTIEGNGTEAVVTWNVNYNGNAEISVRAYHNSCGYSDFSEPLTVTSSMIGIDEYSLQNIKVYPNPADDVVNIKIDGLNGKTELKMYNILGEKVYDNSTTAKEGLNETIHTNVLGKGTYLLIVKSGDNIWRKQIVIK